MTSYASSLGFCLDAAGAPDQLCGGAFIECLTTMPFGRTYIEFEPGVPGRFLTGGPSIDIHEGIDRALKTLGWSAFEWHASPEQPDAEAAAEAVSILREALERFGPALIGPIDVSVSGIRPSYLWESNEYTPVLAYSDLNGINVVHSSVEQTALLPAWRGDRLKDARGRYGLRAKFQERERVSRATAIARAVPLIRAKLTVDPQGATYWGEAGPRVYAGADALRRLARDLAAGESVAIPVDELARQTLPLAQWRTESAAAFLDEAVKPRAAANMRLQAEAFHELSSHLSEERFNRAAAAALRLSELEGSLHDDLR